MPATDTETPRRGRNHPGPTQEVEAPMPGQSYVYFMQGVDGGPIKIGVAHDPQRRLRAVQTGFPHELVLLATVPGGRDLETQLHIVFADTRMKGEWFRPTPLLLRIVSEPEYFAELRAGGWLPTQIRGEFATVPQSAPHAPLCRVCWVGLHAAYGLENYNGQTECAACIEAAEYRENAMEDAA